MVDRLCYPLDTVGELSCRSGSRVILNAKRWVNAVPWYRGHLDEYRAYLVHEVGHRLGHGHSCPAPGAPARSWCSRQVALRLHATVAVGGVLTAAARPSAADTTALASSCTVARWAGPRKDSRTPCRRPRCRTDGPDHACSVRTTRPPIAAPLPGAVVSFSTIGSPASSVALTCSGRAWPVPPSAPGSPARPPARTRVARYRGRLRVVLARRLAGHRGDLRGEQGEQDAVLVGGPVRRPGAGTARSPRRRSRPTRSSGPGTNHEPDRHLDQSAAEVGGDQVDHPRGHDRLADRGPGRPAVRCANG
jgi:hypothetical protein